MLNNVKNHLRKNKNTYIACGVTAVVVGGITYYFTRSGSIIIENVRILHQVNQTGLINKNTIEVYVEALGDPGNIIQDVTTGTIYASQNQAAKALGVYPARISEHLAGKLDHVSGHKLSFLGKAQVSEAVA